MRVSIAKRSALTLLLLSLVVLSLGTACGGNEETTGSGGAGDVEEAAGIGNFNDWDANNNDELNQKEFSLGAFGNWDANNNDEITQEEFNTGTDTWFGNYNGNFNDWDANNNEVLNQEEFNEGIQSNGLFEEWDADNNNVIAENEFNDMSTQV
jgi:hypothetical protein